MAERVDDHTQLWASISDTPELLVGDHPEEKIYERYNIEHLFSYVLHVEHAAFKFFLATAVCDVLLQQAASAVVSVIPTA